MQCGFPDELRLVCSDIRSVNATDMYCGQGRRILAATSRSRRTVCATCKSEARIDGWPSPGRCASPLASGHQARTVPPRGPFPATHLHRTHLHRTLGVGRGPGLRGPNGVQVCDLPALCRASSRPSTCGLGRCVLREAHVARCVLREPHMGRCRPPGSLKRSGKPGRPAPGARTGV